MHFVLDTNYHNNTCKPNYRTLHFTIIDSLFFCRFLQIFKAKLLVQTCISQVNGRQNLYVPKSTLVCCGLKTIQILISEICFPRFAPLNMELYDGRPCLLLLRIAKYSIVRIIQQFLSSICILLSVLP